MSNPPLKKERESCWKAKDLYFDCLDQNFSIDGQISVIEDENNFIPCKDLKLRFNENCPSLWVKTN